MRARVSTALWFLLSCPKIDAQLDRLTLPEAEAIAQRLPEIENAQKRGGCPMFLTNSEQLEYLSFQVRAGCGPSEGQMIGSYTLDRRNGVLALFDHESPLRNPGGAEIAARLVADARARKLSLGESRGFPPKPVCLLRPRFTFERFGTSRFQRRSISPACSCAA